MGNPPVQAKSAFGRMTLASVQVCSVRRPSLAAEQLTTQLGPAAVKRLEASNSSAATASPRGPNTAERWAGSAGRAMGLGESIGAVSLELTRVGQDRVADLERLDAIRLLQTAAAQPHRTLNLGFHAVLWGAAAAEARIEPGAARKPRPLQSPRPFRWFLVDNGGSVAYRKCVAALHCAAPVEAVCPALAGLLSS